jgi:hypothetical protein
MNKPITMDELAAILLTGGRNRKEQSNAKPRHFYGDPALAYEFPSERARREEMRRQEKAKRKGRK